MLTYQNVIELGWIPRDKKTSEKQQCFYWPTQPEYDKFIMSVTFNYDNEPICQLMINLVPCNTLVNEWENSDTHFYGFVRTQEDLRMVMKFLEIHESILS